MNNKGFTLAELLATILILALLIGIGTYSITTIINNAKRKNYELLITNIKDGAETYYQECRYGNTIACEQKSGVYKVSLGDLVRYGFLKGNDTIKTGNETGKYTIANPNDNEDISGCEITITYSSGKVHVNAVVPPANASCPTEEDFGNTTEE